MLNRIIQLDKYYILFPYVEFEKSKQFDHELKNHIRLYLHFYAIKIDLFCVNHIKPRA